jgi:hypothetical protein
MTLFKRVFNNHTTGKISAPVGSRQVEGSEIEATLDEEIVTGITAFADDQTVDASANWDDQVGMPDNPIGVSQTARRPTTEITFQPNDDSNLQDPQSLELNSNPGVDADVAERAVKARQEIEESQKQQKADLKIASTLPDDVLAAQASQDPTNRNDEAAEQFAPVRPGRVARRVRTRMLGFDPGIDAAADPFEKKALEASTPAQKFPVGWVVLVAGPGMGHSFAVFNGVSTIGRGTDQTVSLDFGDSSVSREKHAAIAYDDESNSFFLGHGGKSNIVRLNDRPVLSTEDLSDGDTIRIGETTLRFVALCGIKFAWGRSSNDET